MTNIEKNEYNDDKLNNNVATPRYEDINQGTIAIESSRAIAEAQGKLIIAKRFPRDEIAAYNRMINACRRKELAEEAIFAYNRKKNVVTGPTIRLAEELARCWGNIDYGIIELSQDEGKSEMQAYAWDLETNTKSIQNFTNPHTREVDGKTKKLISQRDIYENNANMGARRLRSRICAILPIDFVNAAMEECKKTVAGDTNQPLIDKVRELVVAFSKFGITKEQIETRLNRKAETMTSDDFSDYRLIYASLNNRSSKVIDWFAVEPTANELTNEIKDEIKNDSKNDSKNENNN